MKNYEIGLILVQTLSEDDRRKVVNKIQEIFSERNAARVKEVEEPGSKKLAYEINHQQRGYYVNFYVETSSNAAFEEFNQFVAVSEKILRHIVIRR